MKCLPTEILTWDSVRNKNCADTGPNNEAAIITVPSPIPTSAEPRTTRLYSMVMYLPEAELRYTAGKKDHGQFISSQEQNDQTCLHPASSISHQTD